MTDYNTVAAITRMPSAVNHDKVDWWVEHGFAIARKRMRGELGKNKEQVLE